MTGKRKNILVLCTGNSARSILAEVLFNRLGGGRFTAFSAGSAPTGKVNPFAIRLLRQKGCEVDGLRSKSWDEFAGAKAPRIDFVITVCDNAAGETCPLWYGNPVTAHWGIADPAAAAGPDAAKIHAFLQAWERLEKRISAFVELPFSTMDDAALKQALAAIGKL